MDVLVRKPGLPLSKVGVLSEENQRRLAALSVTTAEELIGLIAADPAATSTFLGEEGDIPRIEADLGRIAPAAMAKLGQAGDVHFAMGAVPPSGVEVDDRADPEFFEQEVFPAAGATRDVPSGSGTDIAGCMGPIRHQGNRGTCVAHAVCALAECLIFRCTDERLDLSEQFLYWNAKEHDGKPLEEGTLIETAVELSVSDGNCLETIWPYEPEPEPGNEGQGPPTFDAAPDALKRCLNADEPVTERSPKAVCDALDERKPVALSVPVYQNWDGNTAVNTLGELPMPLPTSKRVGGHAMCAVGYGADPEMAGGGYLILRNSWGSDWAPGSRFAPGHALLPFLYLELYGWECRTAAL
jgi:Papain family cysteine protease